MQFSEQQCYVGCILIPCIDKVGPFEIDVHIINYTYYNEALLSPKFSTKCVICTFGPAEFSPTTASSHTSREYRFPEMYSEAATIPSETTKTEDVHPGTAYIIEHQAS